MSEQADRAYKGEPAIYGALQFSRQRQGYLIDQGIVVRNRHRVQLCQDCLRITIGTRQENNELLGALRFYK